MKALEWALRDVIGLHEGPGTLLQNLGQCRGARGYELSFAGRLWRLERTKADLSPSEFARRFTRP